MGRTHSVTICALLLLMSYASAIQTSADATPELEDTPVAEFTGGNQTQRAAFNGTLPAIDDLHLASLSLDSLSCIGSSQSGSFGHVVQDYAQADDGTYYVLGTSTDSVNLMNGQTALQRDALLMHFDQEGNCLDAEAYPQIHSTSATTNPLRDDANDEWHATGVHTLIVLDSNWLILTGSMDLNGDTYGAFGSGPNAIEINSADSEKLIVVKISRANLSIVDSVVFDTSESGNGNGRCPKVGVYPKTFSNTTEFAIAMNFLKK